MINFEVRDLCFGFSSFYGEMLLQENECGNTEKREEIGFECPPELVGVESENEGTDGSIQQLLISSTMRTQQRVALLVNSACEIHQVVNIENAVLIMNFEY